MGLSPSICSSYIYIVVVVSVIVFYVIVGNRSEAEDAPAPAPIPAPPPDINEDVSIDFFILLVTTRVNNREYFIYSINNDCVKSYGFSINTFVRCQ